MKTRHLFSDIFLLVLPLFFLFGCASVQTPVDGQGGEGPGTEQEAEAAPPAKTLEQKQLPVRFQQPAYVLKDDTEANRLGLGQGEEIIIPVGADISSTTGPVPLRDILKRLAALKNMNISWASDVDQHALVDVDIRAEDDFFLAINNILRQMDYYYELKGNTIVVKYRETRKFHIAMPFMASTYNSGVGGNVLGSSGANTNVVGTIQVISEGNKFDIWENIRTNLDQILEIWEETAPPAAPVQASSSDGSGASAPAPVTRRNVQGGKGYYTIDKPIGLITVTAPRPLVEKIAAYLDNLKKELYRQIVIEAKIVEVELADTSSLGINWSGLLKNFQVDIELFGTGSGGAGTGFIYSSADANSGNRVVSALTVTNPFSVILDALKTQGDTRVLANPKLSVMNGQPALISIGSNIRYIDSVSTTVSGDSGTVSTSVETDSVMSGLGMSVIATISDNDEIILSLTPVTSTLGQLDEKTFAGLTVQLPTINIREMNTLVRIKNGDMLVVGGLIDNKTTDDNTKVPLLGDIPLLDKIFNSNTKTDTKKELVIMLQPRII